MSIIRGQTALEYLLMIGGGVLLSAILMVVVNNNLNLAASQVNSSEYTSHIQNYLSTGPAGTDGDWVIVGNDQFSGVPGNVGIGSTNPGAKLEVDGDSKFGGTMNLSGNIITGLAAPVNETDATNKAYVDALGSSSTSSNVTVLLDSTLNVGMPMQGVIDYNSPTSNFGMNTIPLSLPKANCGVKITACYNAPAKMIIGADPVTRITKDANNNLPTPSTATYRTIISAPPIATVCSYGGFGDPVGCVTGMYCAGPTVCCPDGTIIQSDNYCIIAPAAYPLYDTTNHVFYKEPRCNSAGAGELYIQYSLGENTCIYCPSDHPVYDPSSRNCIKNTTITTNSIGGSCSTINTYLPTAFTDVTFLDSSNAPIASFLIKVAYNCPSD